ncbi:hypothetical protein SISNIDRAFT_467489 [Sistotremastrum niveocremeum HHB9708]|uniref:Uncharacterized protein n=1 Tax=Sistotremastrum niveocremeum HHB9708 TaxID=1314777 RepID=A0A164SJL7_9AGAM|nr:hypothetical protein SISNIDRAFT_467489 [Sistotremastrum niveocremeum HHB9708]
MAGDQTSVWNLTSSSRDMERDILEMTCEALTLIQMVVGGDGGDSNGGDRVQRSESPATVSDAEVRFGSVLDLSSPNLEPNFGSVLPPAPGPEPDAASGPQSVRLESTRETMIQNLNQKEGVWIEQ